MKVNYKYIAIAAGVVILYLLFQNKVNKTIRQATKQISRPMPQTKEAYDPEKVSEEMAEEIGEIDLETAQYMN